MGGDCASLLTGTRERELSHWALAPDQAVGAVHATPVSSHGCRVDNAAR